MAPIAFLVLTMALSALIVVLTSRINSKRRPSKLPPGSMGWPLIGEALSFRKPHPRTTLGDFLQQRISRYGKIFTTNLFGKQVIVSAEAELNRFVAQNDMKLFEHGWPKHFVKMFGESALLFATGDAHKLPRSIFLSCFGSSQLEKSIFHEIEGLAATAISSWKDNSVIYAKHEAQKYVFSVIALKTLSMAPGDPKTEMLKREFDTFMKGMYSLPLNFPATAYWKALQSRTFISSAIKEKFEERMQKKGIGQTSQNGDDLLGLLMDNTPYTLEQIIVQLLGVIVAGYASTSVIIPTLIYFLNDCPKALKQLRDEHLQVIGSKSQRGDCKLTWADYKKMDFTQCVINETIRLAAGGFLQRKASRDIQFKDYVIPQGCIVMANVAAMHLDPSLYKDPEHFNPWRWMDASSVKKSNFMPFGGGPRQCPGEEVARIELNVFLHYLILNYNWELVLPDYPIASPHTDFVNGLPIKVQALTHKT